jgi:UDP-4-amino-4,6-dideoxy-N-acetyl-beta-L-altrosamine transaminase
VIPYGKQNISNEDIEAVIKVLRSDFLTQGPVVPLFENKLCDYTSSKYSVVVNSATSALHIACLALGLQEGDVVWTSPITFVASANCALYCNALVDFVDIEADTALICIDKLKEKLEKAAKNGQLPKIVIPVHFAGQSCDMKEIHELSKRYNFSIIEDASHSIGARYQQIPVGSCQYSDITVFSFHPVKIITTGEGGAAMTNSNHLQERMRLLRNHGITRDSSKMNSGNIMPWYYEQNALGFNYRMTDIQASLGLSQLLKLDNFVTKRNTAADFYNNQFKKIEVKPLVVKEDRDSSCHLYVIRVDDSKYKKELLFRHLRNQGIGVNLHYIPVYKQPYYKSNLSLKEAENYYRDALTIPMYSDIKIEDQKFIVDSVSNFLRSKY